VQLVVHSADQFPTSVRIALASTLKERFKVHDKEIEWTSIFLEPLGVPTSPRRMAMTLRAAESAEIPPVPAIVACPLAALPELAVSG
jgi:hypothetical protein